VKKAPQAVEVVNHRNPNLTTSDAGRSRPVPSHVREPTTCAAEGVTDWMARHSLDYHPGNMCNLYSRARSREGAMAGQDDKLACRVTLIGFS
jgi:hypothetical protein